MLILIDDLYRDEKEPIGPQTMREGTRNVKFCNMSVKPGVQKLATRLPKNICANFSRQSPRIFAAVYSCSKVSFASRIFTSSAVLSILTTGHTPHEKKRKREDS